MPNGKGGLLTTWLLFRVTIQYKTRKWLDVMHNYGISITRQQTVIVWEINKETGGYKLFNHAIFI